MILSDDKSSCPISWGEDLTNAKMWNSKFTLGKTMDSERKGKKTRKKKRQQKKQAKKNRKKKDKQ